MPLFNEVTLHSGHATPLTPSPTQLLHEHELLRASTDMEVAAARAEVAQRAADMAVLERDRQAAIKVWGEV